MSIESKILSIVNKFATESYNAGRTTCKALATFNREHKPTANKEKREILNSAGITLAEYETYCKAVYALYMDSLHLEQAQEAHDKQGVTTIQRYFYADLTALVKLLCGPDFEVHHVFENVMSFEGAAVGRVIEFKTASNGFDKEAATLNRWVKWLEATLSTTCSDKVTLSFAERDRLAAIRRLKNKVKKLDEAIKTAEAAIEKATKAKEEAEKKGDQKLIDKRTKALLNLTTEKEQLMNQRAEAAGKLTAKENEKTTFEKGERYDEKAQ